MRSNALLFKCVNIFQTYSNIFRTYTKISGTVIEQSYQWRVAQLAIHHPHVLPHDRHVLGLISIFSSLIVCLSRSIAISACLIRSIESLYCFVRRIRTSLNTLPSRPTSQFLVAARTQNASDIARVCSTDDSTLTVNVQEKIKYSLARIHANVFRRQDICPDRVCVWKIGDAYEYRNAAIWNRCKAWLSHTYDACHGCVYIYQSLNHFVFNL